MAGFVRKRRTDRRSALRVFAEMRENRRRDLPVFDGRFHDPPKTVRLDGPARQPQNGAGLPTSFGATQTMDALATFDPARYAAAFQSDGYSICNDVIPFDDVERLRRAVAGLADREEVRRKQSVYGVRNLLDICPTVRSLAAESRVRQFATAVLGDNAFAVRAIFFDKVPDVNWSLFWQSRLRCPQVVSATCLAKARRKLFPQRARKFFGV